MLFTSTQELHSDIHLPFPLLLASLFPISYIYIFFLSYLLYSEQYFSPDFSLTGAFSMFQTKLFLFYPKQWILWLVIEFQFLKIFLLRILKVSLKCQFVCTVTLEKSAVLLIPMWSFFFSFSFSFTQYFLFIPCFGNVSNTMPWFGTFFSF